MFGAAFRKTKEAAMCRLVNQLCDSGFKFYVCSFGGMNNELVKLAFTEELILSRQFETFQINTFEDLLRTAPRKGTPFTHSRDIAAKAFHRGLKVFPDLAKVVGVGVVFTSLNSYLSLVSVNQVVSHQVETIHENGESVYLTLIGEFLGLLETKRPLPAKITTEICSDELSCAYQ